MYMHEHIDGTVIFTRITNFNRFPYFHLETVDLKRGCYNYTFFEYPFNDTINAVADACYDTSTLNITYYMNSYEAIVSVISGKHIETIFVLRWKIFKITCTRTRTVAKYPFASTVLYLN